MATCAQLPQPSSFLILHGYENHRPPGHWQRWLSLELTARGHDVRYPQLPSPDAPDLARWREAALANLATLTEGTVTVIAHSASAVLWLHEQSRGTRPQVDRVALVSPPDPTVMEGIGPVAGFGPWPEMLAWALGEPAFGDG